MTKLTRMGEISVDVNGVGQKVRKMLLCISVLEKQTGKIRNFSDTL